MQDDTLLGIDIGGTKLAGAVFDADGTILFKENRFLESRQGAEVGALILNLIEALCERRKAVRSRIRIGVGVPGIFNQDKGTVWAPNIPGWQGYPLLNELNTCLPAASITIDSDRACYILGESWKGAAKGCSHAIFLAVGTGIGAGILIDGKVLRGWQDIAGAIGWMALTDPYQPDYATYGCFEYYASGQGMTRLAQQESLRKDKGKGTGSKFQSAQEVFDAYHKGDPVARHVVNQAIGFWGKATANLVSLFNPQKIIFGGGVFGPAGQFMKQIQAEATKWAQPVSMAKVSLEVSTLGADAGLYGAGYLALKGTPP